MGVVWSIAARTETTEGDCFICAGEGRESVAAWNIALGCFRGHTEYRQVCQMHMEEIKGLMLTNKLRCPACPFYPSMTSGLIDGLAGRHIFNPETIQEWSMIRVDEGLVVGES